MMRKTKWRKWSAMVAFLLVWPVAQTGWAQEYGGGDGDADVEVRSTTQDTDREDEDAVDDPYQRHDEPEPRRDDGGYGQPPSQPTDDADDGDREGFWISFGLGAGSLGADFSGERISGISEMIELGGTISSRFLLGGGIHGWVRDDVVVGTATFLTRFYPLDEQGAYVLAGLGVGVVADDFGEEEGGGGVFGVGYDIPIGTGGSWHVTPSLNAGLVVLENVELDFVNLGVGLTYH